MVSRKYTRINAPYTANEINKSRDLLYGSSGGVLSTVKVLSYKDINVKARGNGEISIHSDGKMRLLQANNDPQFNLIASENDWLVIGNLERMRGGNVRESIFQDGGSSNANSLFTDSTSSPFSSKDIGKWIHIHFGDNAGIYQIDAYTNASTVSLNGSGFSTSTGQTYSILEDLSNFGIHRVDKHESSSSLTISFLEEFFKPTPGGTDTGSGNVQWSLADPPEITFAPFSFMHKGIIIREDAPVSISIPPPPPGFSGNAYIVGINEDSRPESSVDYRVIYGTGNLENSTLIACASIDSLGKSSAWNPVFPDAIYPEKEDDDKYSLSYSALEYPPKVFVKNKGEEQLRFPVISPFSQRYDLIHKKEVNPFNHSFSPERDRGGALKKTSRVLEKMTGISLGDFIESSGNENSLLSASSSFSVVKSDTHDTPVSFNEANVLANHFGTQVYLYHDKGPGVIPGLKISINRDTFQNSPDDIFIAAGDEGSRGVKGHVDSKGFFWLTWIEKFSGSDQLWATILDPYAGNILVNPLKVSGAISIHAGQNHGCKSDANGNHYFYWINTNGRPNVCRSRYKTGELLTVSTPHIVHDAISSPFFTIEVDEYTGDIFAIYGDSALGETHIMHMLNDYSSYFSETIPLLKNDANQLDFGTIDRIDSCKFQDGKSLCVFSSGIDSSSENIVSGMVFSGRDFKIKTLARTSTSQLNINSLCSLSSHGFAFSGYISSLSVSSIFDSSMSRQTYDENVHSTNDPLSMGLSIYQDYASGTIHALSVKRNVSNEDSVYAGKMNIHTAVLEKDNIDLVGSFHVHDFQVPDKPGLSMHKASNSSPAGTILDVESNESKRLVDGMDSTFIETDTDTSVGLSHMNAFVYGVCLVDSILSDGFNPSINPLVDIEIYTSNDNDAWTKRDIRKIERFSGHTYIDIEGQAARYIQALFKKPILVPGMILPEFSEVMKVTQMRTFSKDLTEFIDPVSKKYKPYSRHPSLSTHQELSSHIYIGDGKSSFGDIDGIDNLADIFDQSRHAQRKVFSVTVLEGVHHLTKKLRIPSHTHIVFAKNSIVYDMNQSGHSIQIEGFKDSSVNIFNKAVQIYSRSNVLPYGVREGSLVQIGDQLTKVRKIDLSGKFITLHDPFEGSSGSYDVTYFASGINILGMNMETYRSSDNTLNKVFYCKNAANSCIDISINDDPDNASTFNPVLFENSRDMEISVKGRMVTSINAVKILNCEDSKVALDIVNPSGVAILLESCKGLTGHNSITGKGSGSEGEDVHLKDMDNTNGLGIIYTQPSLNGKGLKIESSDPSAEEFVNLLVHRRGDINILNGGIYESLHSVALSIIQSEHSLPSMPTSSGYIDGLVSDAIIDAGLSV